MRTDSYAICALLGLLIGLSTQAFAADSSAPATRPARQASSPDVPSPQMRNGKIDKRFAGLHETILRRGKSGPIGLLFIGDSITEGWQWDGTPAVFKEHFGKYDPANFGVSSDQTQNVLWRFENGELDNIHPKAIVLLIGTNNIGYPAEAILRGDTKVVDEIHRRLPEANLLIMGVFPRGLDPAANRNVASMRTKIKIVNEGLAKLADGEKTRFLDLADKFVEADGKINKTAFRNDYLHLVNEGYKIWADAIQPIVDEMMK